MQVLHFGSLSQHISLSHSLEITRVFLCNLKMYFNTLIVASILAASASATLPEGVPYKLAIRSLNPAYGLVKRQSGYQPSQTFCSGYGTCAEACGTGYETCASTDGDVHCFNPTVKETCCPTGTGGMSSSLHMPSLRNT